MKFVVDFEGGKIKITSKNKKPFKGKEETYDIYS